MKLPPEETTEEFTFTVAVKGGKTHMFAAADEQDIQAWLKVLQVSILIHVYRRFKYIVHVYTTTRQLEHIHVYGSTCTN